MAGQGGPLRGGRQALIDLELGFPGGNLLMAGGTMARPLLAPFALRTTPLSTKARTGLLMGLVGAIAAIASALRRYGGRADGCTGPSAERGKGM